MQPTTTLISRLDSEDRTNRRGIKWEDEQVKEREAP